jgi:hypothetical protein
LKAKTNLNGHLNEIIDKIDRDIEVILSESERFEIAKNILEVPEELKTKVLTRCFS